MKWLGAEARELAVPTAQGQCDQGKVVIAASRSTATELAALSDDSPSPMQVGSLLPSPLRLGLRDLTHLKGRRVQKGRHLVVGGY